MDPRIEILQIALSTMATFLASDASLERVIMVCFSGVDLATCQRVYGELDGAAQ